MKRRKIAGAAALFVLAGGLGAALEAGGDSLLPFSAEEVNAIVSHGPWPLPWSPDPSNRASGNPDAISLGERLFFDPRLSVNGKLSCGSCHEPERNWIDGEKRGFGLARVDRNTPSLLDVRLQRWFGHDGAADSLWSQSMRPITDARELGATPAHVAQLVRNDAQLACRYENIFGEAPPTEDEAVLVGVGKLLAAFQETIISGRTPFDRFRDAMASGDRQAAAQYSLPAQRGLKIFIGKGACNTCHFGPNFTNNEFADTGISYFIEPGRVDPGRHGGIQKLKASPFNLLSRWNDDARRSTATSTRHVEPEQRNFGEFKVPTLRNAVLNAPYMHDGSLATLRDVINHYSELDEERLHADGQRILKPLRLSPDEASDLLVFLESVSSFTSPWRGNSATDDPPCMRNKK
jgi:cytochrome c peroxidase